MSPDHGIYLLTNIKNSWNFNIREGQIIVINNISIYIDSVIFKIKKKTLVQMS